MCLSFVYWVHSGREKWTDATSCTPLKERPSTALAFASFTLRSEYSTARRAVCVAHRGLRLKEFIVRLVTQPRRRCLSFRLSLPSALMEYTSNSTGDSGFNKLHANGSAGDGSWIRVSMTLRRLEKFSPTIRIFIPLESFFWDIGCALGSSSRRCFWEWIKGG